MVLFLAAFNAFSFPVPTALPPHSWATVGDKLFMHGCNADGLFNASELERATRYSMLTVEKGQGLNLPGFADEKMAAIAAQWKSARRAAGKPDGWTMFYVNAKLDWTFYRLHAKMEAHPSWATQQHERQAGDPCLLRGDPTFPQPAAGMLTFNHSKAVVRAAFVAACVNATTPVAQGGGGFDGCFVDSASWARGPPYPDTSAAKIARDAAACHTTVADYAAVGTGTEELLAELQAAVGSTKLIITKDVESGGSSQFTNAAMLKDTFCSNYNGATFTATMAASCQTQIETAIALGKRGQVPVLHGEVNADLKGNATALQEDFLFSLAAFLVVATDSAFFGYSDGWYYSGTEWHDEFERPLGAPLANALQGAGLLNMTWTRAFASGTNVTLDVANHAATIVWG